MARTILYRRTSTDEQQNGMAAQFDQLEDAAERNRWPNPIVVIDLNRFSDRTGRPEPDRWVGSLDRKTCLKIERALPA
jgi:DNA invertase Pin-like site-specific DNA recombinase